MYPYQNQGYPVYQQDLQYQQQPPIQYPPQQYQQPFCGTDNYNSGYIPQTQYQPPNVSTDQVTHLSEEQFLKKEFDMLKDNNGTIGEEQTRGIFTKVFGMFNGNSSMMGNLGSGFLNNAPSGGGMNNGMTNPMNNGMNNGFNNNMNNNMNNGMNGGMGSNNNGMGLGGMMGNFMNSGSQNHGMPQGGMNHNNNNNFNSNSGGMSNMMGGMGGMMGGMLGSNMINQLIRTFTGGNSNIGFSELMMLFNFIKMMSSGSRSIDSNSSDTLSNAQLEEQVSKSLPAEYQSAFKKYHQTI